MNRLFVALGAYAVLAILALTTIDDRRFKLATLAILALFAVRTLTLARKRELEKLGESDQDGDRRNLP